jgi:hypothetical protein
MLDTSSMFGLKTCQANVSGHVATILIVGATALAAQEGAPVQSAHVTARLVTA